MMVSDVTAFLAATPQVIKVTSPSIANLNPATFNEPIDQHTSALVFLHTDKAWWVHTEKFVTTLAVDWRPVKLVDHCVDYLQE